MSTLTGIVELAGAADPRDFGPKAAQLGAALRAGLPVPAGLAVSHRTVSRVSASTRGCEQLISDLQRSGIDGAPRAVRSSAVGEDSAQSSFAGVHLSVLGVCGAAAVAEATRRVHASARTPGALAYRNRRGPDLPIQMAVIIQDLVDADVAGVMFTRNPVTGTAERVIEASWGLGESVVAGLVTPDRYVLNTAGQLIEQQLGDKDLAVRRAASGGTFEEPVRPGLVGTACLGSDELGMLHELALRCDDVFGSADHDIEFAFRGRRVYLLQRRPITRG